MLRNTILAIALGAVTTAVAQDPLKVNGSSTITPIVERAKQVYGRKNPDVKIDLQSTGSSGGISSAASGEAQIGMCSRELKSSEKEKHPELVSHELGLDAIAVLVHRSNPVKALTKQQILGIYTGKLTNWKDLGGPNKGIVAYSQTTNHGTFDAFASTLNLGGKTDAGKVALTAKDAAEGTAPFVVAGVDGGDAGLAALEKEASGIVFLSLGLAERAKLKGLPVTVLNVENVKPCEETVRNGSYCFSRKLLLLTKGQPEGRAKDFLEFMLGKQGQMLVQSLDFLPAAPVK